MIGASRSPGFGLHIGLVAVLAVGCIAAAEPVPLPGIVHDVGAVYPGEHVAKVFTVHNTDSAPWKITELKPSCKCMVSQPASLDIPVGGSVDVPIVFAVGDKVDWPVAAHISAIIQRPTDIAEIPLSVTAVVRSPVAVPSRVVMAPHQSTIAVQVSRGGHPAPWTRLGARVVSGSEVLTVAEPTPEADGWTLAITSHPGTWSGTILGRIELSCLAEGQPLPYSPSIVVVAHLEGRLRSAPAALLLGIRTPDESAVAQAQVSATVGSLAGAVVTTSDSRFTATLDPISGLLSVAFHSAPPLGSANAWAEVACEQDRLRIPLIAGVALRPSAEAQ